MQKTEGLNLRCIRLDKKQIMKKCIVIMGIVLGFQWCATSLYAQPVPAADENIPFLVTFGKQASRSWGDDDYVQSFFFSLPEEFKQPFYLRVFDPECKTCFR